MLAQELVETCPFYDKATGKMRAKWTATWDRVFAWQPNTPLKSGLIHIPDTVRDWHKPQIAVILSVGKGWHDDKKFYPMFLQPGWVVIFDMRIPYHMDLENWKGEMHPIRYMGEQDVRAIVSMDQNIDGIGELICKNNFMSRAVRLGGLG